MIFSELILSFYKKLKIKGSRADKSDPLFVLNRLKKNRDKKIKSKGIVKESILKYLVSAYDYKTLHYLFNEIFISNEYHFDPETKEPLILDCGANIGMASLYFKWIFPDCKIIAFEPNPNSFSLLEKNIKDNRLEKIKCYNVGLSDKKGKMPFYIDNDNPTTLRGSIKKGRGGLDEIMVQTTKLSAYIAKYENIDLVKMDVEGAEFEIVKELSSTDMIRKVREFIIEYHHNLPGEMSNLSQFLDVFETQGYDYNIRTNFSKIKSFQNIIIHFYKKEMKKD